MLSLVLAAAFFIAIHLGVAGTTLRRRAVAALGERGFGAAFSLASLAGLAWLAIAYRGAPYLPSWGVLVWWKPVILVLMLPATALVVIGLLTPNPTAVAQEARLAEAPSGMLRVTRHPFLTGVGLWALLHLIGNGDLASLVLFGALAIVALAGTVSIDAKRRRAAGAAWERFAAATSIIPFAAIAAGHNKFRPGEIGLWRWAAALLVYVLLLGAHGPLIGISPFP
jgi:uncharacterized membrane protein